MTFHHKSCGGEVIDGTSATEYPDGDIELSEERTCLHCSRDVPDSELELVEEDS